MSTAQFGVRNSEFGIGLINSELRTLNSEFRSRGQMLILVLWVMGIISLAVGALTVWSSHELRLGSIHQDMLKRRAIAEAGLQQAIAILNSDEDKLVDHLNESWATGLNQNQEQRLENVSVGDGQFSVGVREGESFHVGVIDEERKLNVNTAAENQLKDLIASLPIDGIDAHGIASAIIDWRTSSDPEGALCAGLDPACHNAALDSVDELLVVPGISPELFTALIPYVTVYGTGLINANTASLRVLNSIGCDGDAIISQRENAGPFTSPPCNGTSVSSSVFTVPVEAKLNSISSFLSIAAVVDRAGCSPTPPEGSRCILAWNYR